jgi:hypothetical protein
MEEFLKEISKYLDKTLDVPTEEWGDKQIKLYNVLDHKLKKYKTKYCEIQFQLDKKDIIKNINSQPWFEESHFKKTINWYLNQLVIKSYHNSSRNPGYKLCVNFPDILVDVTIIRKDKLVILIESPKLRTDLSDPRKIAEVFNLLSKKISPEQKMELINHIQQMIQEIAIFYD